MFFALSALVASAIVSPLNFHTPSGNIVCNGGALPNKPMRIDCVVFSRTSSRTGQADWYMNATGRSRFHYVFANIGTDVPRLGYGRTVRDRGIVCTSRRKGLTCRNRSGHGFFLSRERQTRF